MEEVFYQWCNDNGYQNYDDRLPDLEHKFRETYAPFVIVEFSPTDFWVFEVETNNLWVAGFTSAHLAYQAAAEETKRREHAA